MGVLLQQKLDQAVAEAEAHWRREEPSRFAAEKARLEEQFEQKLAERESRIQAIADIAREQQAAQIRRLAQELGTAQETLASRDGELAASRAALERARAETESEAAAARQAAQAKASEALKAAGYVTVSAATVAEVVENARKSKPAVIALDTQLGRGGDGFKALTALKADAELQGIPVVLICPVKDRERAMELGVAGCVASPAAPNVLLGALNAALVAHKKRAERSRMAAQAAKGAKGE